MEMPQCVYVCVSQRCQVISGLFAAKWQAFFSPPSLVLFFFFLIFWGGAAQYPPACLTLSSLRTRSTRRGTWTHWALWCRIQGYKDPRMTPKQDTLQTRKQCWKIIRLLCLECTICVSEHLSNQHRSSPNSHKIYGLKSTSINLWIQVFSVPVLTYSEGETSHRNILLFVPYCKYTF